MKRSFLLAGLLAISVASVASADLTGVAWAPDSTADGLDSGTLGALGVSLVSTDGAVNGGDTFTAGWPSRAGTKDVPGIAGLAEANRTAIDWNSGVVGFATITFTGGTVTNPILLADFTDPHETFAFDPSISVKILDRSPAGSVTLSGSNVVTLDGSPSNGQDDSFAIQLLGTFSTFTFSTNLNLIESESIGFTVAANLTPVPEPGSLALTAIGVLGVVGFGRWRGARPGRLSSATGPEGRPTAS
jgi:hypothetical protein